MKIKNHYRGLIIPVKAIFIAFTFTILTGCVNNENQSDNVKVSTFNKTAIALNDSAISLTKYFNHPETYTD